MELDITNIQNIIIKSQNQHTMLSFALKYYIRQLYVNFENLHNNIYNEDCTIVPFQKNDIAFCNN